MFWSWFDGEQSDSPAHTRREQEQFIITRKKELSKKREKKKKNTRVPKCKSMIVGSYSNEREMQRTESFVKCIELKS
jgi:hypothetical protein